jgi:hypothetical protein
VSAEGDSQDEPRSRKDVYRDIADDGAEFVVVAGGGVPTGLSFRCVLTMARPEREYPISPRFVRPPRRAGRSHDYNPA